MQTPEYYQIYPVPVIDIARHLGFCMGNVIKYILRAPYKDGEADCKKAIHYLEILGLDDFCKLSKDEEAKKSLPYIEKLLEAIRQSDGDSDWQKYKESINLQLQFVQALIAHNLPDALCQAIYKSMISCLKAYASKLRSIAVREPSEHDPTGLPIFN